MRKLVPDFPEHVHHVSVFGGTGAELLSVRPSPMETYNDINRTIVNFFRVLRDANQCRELCDELEFTPLSRLEYSRACHLLQHGCEDRLTMAYALSVVGNQMRTRDPTIALPRQWTSGITKPRHRRWLGLPGTIRAVARRFMRVQLENQSWERIIDRYDAAKTFFTVDPPYLRCTLASQRLYGHEMSDIDHERLLVRLQHIEGYAMVFGYSSQLYSDLLGRWRLITIPTRSGMSSGRTRRVEHVWVNY